MKDFDTEIDSASLLSFLEFLVRSKHSNEDMLHRLIRRLATDDAYPFGFKECAVLSQYLLFKVPHGTRRLKLSNVGPLLLANLQYLQINPEKLNEVRSYAMCRCGYI